MLCQRLKRAFLRVQIKSFINQDVIEGNITNSPSLNKYAYCQGNPVSLLDPFGLNPLLNWDWNAIGHAALDLLGMVPGAGFVADVVNGIWYCAEGKYFEAAGSFVSAIPGAGDAIGLAAKGITARNQLIEMATASLSDLMKEHPEHRAEAKQDLQLLNAQKMGEHEAEIEKIKNVFLAILRDIKKDIDSGEQPGETITAAMFQTMQEAMKNHQQEPLSMDDVTAMIVGQVGQLLPMDEETSDQFQQLAKKMIELAGKETKIDGGNHDVTTKRSSM